MAAQEIALIRIIGADNIMGKSVSASSGSSESSGAGIASMTKGFGSILKGLGIATAAAAIIRIASQMNQLIAVIDAIMKLVSFLLKPIADVIMVLLMPILYILKPIVQAVNTIMAPFLKQAMKVMAEFGKSVDPNGHGTVNAQNAFMGGMMIILNGLSAALVTLSAVIVKQFAAVFIDSTTALLQVFANWIGMGDAFRGITDSIKSGINVAVDTTAAIAVAQLAAQSADISKTIGVNADTLRIDAYNAITKVFTGAQGINETLANMLGVTDPKSMGKVGTTAIDDTASKMGGALMTGFDSVSKTGQTAIEKMMNDLKNSFQKKVSAVSVEDVKKSGVKNTVDAANYVNSYLNSNGKTYSGGN